MSKKKGVNDTGKMMLSDNIKKEELFRFMKNLHPECDSLKAIKNTGELSSGGPKQRSLKTRQSRTTTDLLRRYFAQRMTQISGGAR